MKIQVLALTLLFATTSVFGQVQIEKKQAVKKETVKPVSSTTQEKKASDKPQEAKPGPGTKIDPVKKPVKSETQTTPIVDKESKPVTTPKDIAGYWLTAQKGSIIQFKKQGDLYNGTIVWLRQPNDDSGKPMKDVNNPDKAKQNNLVVGTQMVFNLKYNEKTGYYEGGRVYQPQTGRSFDCRAKLLNNGKTLEITGTNAAQISKTLTWTRTDGIPGKGQDVR